MTELTENELFKISDLILDLYNSDTKDIRISFFENIQKVVPFDVGTFFTGNNINGQKLLTDPIAYNHPVDKVKDSNELFKTYENLQSSDYGSWILHQKESMVVRETDILPDSIREKSEIFKKIFEPIGMHYCCSIYIMSDEILLGLANLFRKKENHDFTGRELFILEYIKPHRTQRVSQLHPQVRSHENIKNKMIRDFNLTGREYQIIVEICNGDSNKEIGDNLFVSENTIKKHILNIFKKMNVTSRSELMKLFYERFFGKIYL